MNKRVAVVGMASFNPLGLNEARIIEGIKNVTSTPNMIDLFPSQSFPYRVAAQVDSQLLNRLSQDIPEHDYFQHDRKTMIGITTVVEAFRELQADFTKVNPYDLGISLGIGINNIHFEQLLHFFDLKKANHLRQFYDTIFHTDNGTQVSYDYISKWIRRYYNFAGPALNNLSACAASTQAIGTAYRWIKYGKAKMVITGGVDSILNPIGITGFSLLGTLTSQNHEPKKASRPFDLHRDGFIPGEGAGILFLEELEQAKSRGAQIYGEILGYGSSMDAYKVTAPSDDGSGAALSMEQALKDASWSLDTVQYINAHGTSTYLNDRAETKAIYKVFKERAVQIPVSSCKSQIGHLIASSGAVELIMCLLALREGLLPANINLETPDPECNLNLIANRPRAMKVERFIKNSFALGGQNATLAVEVGNL